MNPNETARGGEVTSDSEEETLSSRKKEKGIPMVVGKTRREGKRLEEGCGECSK